MLALRIPIFPAIFCKKKRIFNPRASEIQKFLHAALERDEFFFIGLPSGGLPIFIIFISILICHILKCVSSNVVLR